MSYLGKFVDQGADVSSPTVCTVLANVAGGTMLILISSSGSGIRPTGIVDTKSNTWASAATTTTSRSVSIWYALVTTPLTTSDTITVTWNGGPTNGSILVSGYTNVLVFDKQNATQGSGASQTSGTTGTLAFPGEFVVSAFGYNGATSVTPPAGFQYRGVALNSVGGISLGSGDCEVAATDALNPSWTYTAGASNNSVAVATFTMTGNRVGRPRNLGSATRPAPFKPGLAR